MKKLLFLPIVAFGLLSQSAGAQGVDVSSIEPVIIPGGTPEVALNIQFFQTATLPITAHLTLKVKDSNVLLRDTTFEITDYTIVHDLGHLQPLVTYTWAIALSNSFGSYSDQQDFDTPATVGIAESNKGKLQFYPNPVSSELFIQNADAGAAVVVNNMLGKTVLSGSIESTTKPEQISFENQPAGIYFVTTTAGGKTVTRKIHKK